MELADNGCVAVGGIPVTIAGMSVVPASTKLLAVSVVSHGHGLLVAQLLLSLARHCAGSVARVILTLNVPEAEPVAPDAGWPFDLQIRRNALPLGFGANHNLALHAAEEPFVCVLNPDVVFLEGSDPLAVLVAAAQKQGVGCAYPSQVDGHGVTQDCERQLPTLPALVGRRLLGRSDVHVDWVNAACLVFPLPVWREVRGFDEAYFMYCEDVDICLRVRLLGLALAKAPVSVVHAGQRASHRNWRHLSWHIRSLLRLWCTPTFWQARQLLQSNVTSGGRITPP